MKHACSLRSENVTRPNGFHTTEWIVSLHGREIGRILWDDDGPYGFSDDLLHNLNVRRSALGTETDPLCPRLQNFDMVRCLVRHLAENRPVQTIGSYRKLQKLADFAYEKASQVRRMKFDRSRQGQLIFTQLDPFTFQVALDHAEGCRILGNFFKIKRHYKPWQLDDHLARFIGVPFHAKDELFLFEAPMKALIRRFQYEKYVQPDQPVPYYADRQRLQSLAEQALHDEEFLDNPDPLEFRMGNKGTSQGVYWNNQFLGVILRNTITWYWSFGYGLDKTFDIPDHLQGFDMVLTELREQLKSLERRKIAA